MSQQVDGLHCYNVTWERIKGKLRHLIETVELMPPESGHTGNPDDRRGHHDDRISPKPQVTLSTCMNQFTFWTTCLCLACVLDCIWCNVDMQHIK